MRLIDFDLFIKILGGTTILGLIPYFSQTLSMVSSLLDSIIAIEKTRKAIHKIENKVISKEKFEKEIEDALNQFQLVPTILKAILWLTGVAFFSVLLYAFFKDMYFPFQEKYYFILIVLPNNIAFLLLPAGIFVLVIWLYNINLRFISAKRIWQEKYGNNIESTDRK
jgi:hypothetical protein